MNLALVFPMHPQVSDGAADLVCHLDLHTNSVPENGLGLHKSVICGMMRLQRFHSVSGVQHPELVWCPGL